MYSLKGKNVLITGAAGGIGLGIIKLFKKAGASIIITGRDEKKLADITSGLDEGVNFVVADLMKRSDVEKLIERSEELSGGIDIVVANAGLTKDNLSMKMSDAEWDEVIRVNLTSVFELNRGFVSKMMRRRYGRIINITSVVAFTGNKGQVNYTASKAGLVGMTKSFAKEVASRGITVNCIAPGFISTKMTDVLSEDQKRLIKGNIPMARMGEVEDIANAALFLASSENSYMTGETLHVNGGLYM